MSATLASKAVSVADYLREELLSEEKREFVGGNVFAIGGHSNRHNQIATNLLGALGSRLRGKPCRPFNSDTKVRIELANHTRFYYPDAMVVCDRNRDDEQWQDRPVVIVEVLSESTRRTDLGEKRDAYLAIPTLKVLLIVEPGEAAATLYRRGPSGGFTHEHYSGSVERIPLPEIEVELSLGEFYEGLEP
jgi:Uma2 family endonuclease